MITLLTTIYPIASPARLEEIRTCMFLNCENPFVDRVCVFAERWDECVGQPGYEFLKHDKVQTMAVDGRPTYRQFFAFSRAMLKGVVAVCNSDVYFDESITYAANVPPGQLWCLCRYNILPDGKLELQGGGKQGSADAWIFHAPIKCFDDDIQLGVRGCDSYLAQKAEEAGIEVKNPCFTIVMKHLHRDGERNDAPGGKSYWDKPDYRCHTVRPCR